MVLRAGIEPALHTETDFKSVNSNYLCNVFCYLVSFLSHNSLDFIL
jgi:hypothetical protein